MKTKAFLMCLSMSFAGLVASCTSESEEPGLASGKGYLSLDLISGTEFETGTRAVNEAAYKNTDDYMVTIKKGQSVVFGPDKFSVLKTQLPKEFENGSYEIIAEYGKEFASSRDDFYVVGSQVFSVGSTNSDQTQNSRTNPERVNLVCSPTCGKVSVAFDAEMATYYTSYLVAFSGTEAMGTGSAVWNKTDDAPWYLKLKAGDAGETITYTIHLDAKEEFATLVANGSKVVTDAQVVGTFTLKRNTAYKLNIAPSYQPTGEGGLSIIITIDESTNDKPIEVEVPVTWVTD